MEKILMGGIVGFTLFTLVSYILIVLHVPFLIIPITILGIILSIKPLIKTIKQIKIKFNIQTFLVLAVFALGILGQLAIISPSGTFQNGNLAFWSANGHDGSWHIALMEEIKKGFPFENPSFAGEKLVNYHFFSDIAPAIISKYLPLSDLDLYFRIFPFIYSVFLGASAFYLTRKITNSFGASLWATIFTYFAGSFGFIVTYLKNKTIGGESIFWATQIQSSSGNPPQIVSDFLILAALYFLTIFLQKKGSKLIFAVCVLLFGTLAEFKVYAAIVLLGVLFLVGIWQILRERKIQIFLLAIVSGALAAILYLPNSTGSVSFLIFQPWWYIRTMIVEPSRLNLIDWELKRQTYIYEHNLKRVIFLEGVGFLIFFFGNLGMRFIGLWELIRMLKDSLKNYFNLIFILVILSSLALPLLFLQKGVASNTSQFLQYFILLFGILAGITTARFIKLIKIPVFQIPVALLLIVIMVPTQIGLLHEFYGSPQYPRSAFAKISKAELQALKFVKENTPEKDVILTPPYNQYLNLGGATPNIWDWFDTSYVSAFTSRRTYMDDYEQADIMGYDYRSRLEIKKTIFESEKEDEVKIAIGKTNANLIYFPKPLAPKVNLESLNLTKLFDNQEVEVWKIK
jgi:hypothetical protein